MADGHSRAQQIFTVIIFHRIINIPAKPAGRKFNDEDSG